MMPKMYAPRLFGDQDCETYPLIASDRSIAVYVASVADSEIARLKAEVELHKAALQKVMARLCDLLDEDHFLNIEAIVLAAGVTYPDQVTP